MPPNLKTKTKHNKTKTETKQKQTKKEVTGFCSLKKKTFSWEIDLWVTLGDFTVKKPANLGSKILENSKIGKENIFNWKSIYRNEMWCAANNHNYVFHICAKERLYLNFN